MSPSSNITDPPSSPSLSPIDRSDHAPIESGSITTYIANLDDLFHEGLVSQLCGTALPHPMDWE